MADPQSILHDRFGLGARPDTAHPRDVRGALREQLRRFDPAPRHLRNSPDLGDIGSLYARMISFRANARGESMEAQEALGRAREMRELDHQHARQGGFNRLTLAAQTDSPFAERLVHFWSNHFAVSVDRMPMHSLACHHEFSAIRPHIMGNFADLVKSAVGHPAMLVFLNQTESIGPGSEFGIWAARRRGRRGVGINENLARELLELHTLGVRSGYSQDDVTELAKALTGWTIGGFARNAQARFVDGEIGQPVFAAALHEPGTRTILGRQYRDTGADQSLRIITDLATHPATARHIATKLARHFIADDPPETAIARLERAFIDSGGELTSVYDALIDAPEVWAAERTKFRTPWDWLVASLRATATDEIETRGTMALLNTLGQPLWRPGHPAGWSDQASDWASPGALLTRVEIANRLARGPARRIDAAERAQDVLGGALRPATLDAIMSAQDERGVGLALLLSSPEFLRR